MVLFNVYRYTGCNLSDRTPTMTAHEATSSLSAWRKKVTGSKRETLSM